MGKVAFITGASRGVGQATAVALAEAGFDVAVAARTMHEGEGRDETDFAPADAAPVPGSLDVTANLVEQAGGKALRVRLDLLDHASIRSAVETVRSEWGEIDVLVNNAVSHRGNTTALIDLTDELVQAGIGANLVGPLTVIRTVLPGMLARGEGRIVNLTSRAGKITPPPATEGRGSWGILYGMAKGGIERIPGIVARETADRGILCFNVDPGFVKTPLVVRAPNYADRTDDVPPTVAAEAIAWLATSSDAEDLNGQSLTAEELHRERVAG
jgi:NAD(P)-dependent dehydrogenase (short-subunit alcohol dehydrogenase family)